MEKTDIKKMLNKLNLPLEYFDVDELYFQLRQLEQKIRIVEELPNLRDHPPNFILSQGRDQYDK